eukprot:gene28137-37035_t
MYYKLLRRSEFLVAFLFLTLSYSSHKSELAFSAVTSGDIIRIENALETEIDVREPRNFPSHETLNTRMSGFKTMSTYKPDGSFSTFGIGNWEVFAAKYWYETRIVNSTCSQEPYGISAACDWALMVPCLFGNPYKAPRTIFVMTYMLPHFVESTLAFIDHFFPDARFVVVSGGTDATIPRSAGDSRFKLLRGFNGGDGGPGYHTLLNHPRIIHWFAENHDLSHPSLSTLPTGMAGEHPDDRTDFPPPMGKNPDLNASSVHPIEKRDLRVMVSDRVRSGTGQWATRASVIEMCDKVSWCYRPKKDSFDNNNGLNHKEFIEELITVPFIACAHGGGIDPSPKAWESILAGTIPIIEKSPLSDGYERLPVMFVDNWASDLFENPHAEELLEETRKRLAPFYAEGSALRKRTLERLKTEYWVGLFERKIHEDDLKRAEAATNAAP